MPISSNGPATGFDIVAYRGDTFERWLRVRRNGVEDQLGGAFYNLQIRSGAQLIKQLTQPAPDSDSEGFRIESVYNGVMKITMSYETMVDLPAGQFEYDLQQRVLNRVKTLIRGKFTITDDISK